MKDKKQVKKKPDTTKKSYSLGEEIFNSTTHLLGSGISIAALVIMIVISVGAGSPIKLGSSIVFGISLLLLYMMSTLYHAITNPRAKSFFKVLDHCAISILIAGTYTPFALVAIGGTFGWIIFGIIWASALVGIVFNAIDVKRYKLFSTILYVLMGWAIVFTIQPLIESIPLGGIILLAVGGLFYTLGLVFYLIKSKKYFHSIWHIFVLLGSVCHILAVILYVLL